jgi:predicted RNase H-like nuclease (RuvC/YqgF family)
VTTEEHKTLNTISIKQLRDLKDTLKRLQTDNDKLKKGDGEDLQEYIEQLEKRLKDQTDEYKKDRNELRSKAINHGELQDKVASL